MLDYASLRAEGIRLLERMNGDQWTDFNTHDPGITILEQLCYALTDLGYRSQYGIPDLLAEGGADPYRSLPPPGEILTVQPVTVDDLRRLVLDVEGVRNAWVEAATADSISLYYLPLRRELRFVSQELGAQPVLVRGLYRVLIESTGTRGDGEVQAEVAARLHRCRGLGSDYADIRVLEAQPIQVEATLELAPVDDPRELFQRIRQRLADEIAPRVRFSSLAELLEAGLTFEEIFEGPRLDHGFLPAAVLSAAPRRTVIHTSDLMHAMMGIPGVRAVSRIRVAKGGAWEEWALGIDADKAARLDPKGLKLTLRRAGKTLAVTPLPLADTADTADTGTTAKVLDAAELARPAGRSRRIGRYTSVQRDLPVLYGVGPAGLPDSVGELRKAQARQLKAYLMLFDQLLANSFAQLANVNKLFTFGSEPQTYFTQALDQAGLGPELRLGEVCTLDEAHKRRLQDAVEVPGGDDALERQNRFLNHLLARFAEPIGDLGLDASLLQRARQKQRLLAEYPRFSSARGCGYDSLHEDAESCLEDRLQLELNLDAQSGEVLVLVENIFFRPMKDDVLSDPQAPSVALLAGAQAPDPYSLQVTVVLPDGAGRFARSEFKQLAEQTLRQHLPAHLTPYVLWLDAAAWTRFLAAHTIWRKLRRDYLAQGLGMKREGAATVRAIELRGARDRLIDVLGIGETYPLADTSVTAKQLTVDYGESATVLIDPSQSDVRYELYEGDTAVMPLRAIDGTGGLIELAGPTIREDHTYRIRAYKRDKPERQLFLLQKATVKIGLRRDLPVTFQGISADAPLVDYGSQVTVKIQQTQSGVSYWLIDPSGAQVSMTRAIGNGSEVSLLSKPLLEDTVLRIEGRREFDASENREPLDTILSATQAIAVRANPAVTAVVSTGATDSSVISDYAGAATLTLTGSQKSVVYSAYARPLLDAEILPTLPAGSGTVLTVPVSATAAVYVPRPARTDSAPTGFTQLAQAAGTDGTLQLTLAPILDDLVVVVQAQKQHAAVLGLRSELQLVQAAVVLVRPSPVPALALTLTPSGDGTSGTLLVAGGEPGVFYRFLRADEAAELGLPAYVQKLDDSTIASGLNLNKGVGQVRISTDLVVARDQALGETAPDLSRLVPLPPSVTVSPLPQGTVKVMAQKARTLVKWSLVRTFTVTST